MFSFVSPPGALRFRPGTGKARRRLVCRSFPVASAVQFNLGNRLYRLAQTFSFYSPVRSFLRPARLPGTKQPNRFLVVDANALLGSYVIRALIESGSDVTAAARDVHNARLSLGERGVDVGTLEKKKRLRFVQMTSEALDKAFDSIHGVVYCGDSRGPLSGDSSNEEEVLETEYDTIKSLADRATDQFATRVSDEVDYKIVLDFSDRKKTRTMWGSVDDIVMGGVSASSVRVDSQGNLVLEGLVSTDNYGGFVSARTANFGQPLDLSAYDGLAIKVKGDGNSYKFIARSDQRWNGVAHAFTFPTERGKWTTVRVPFSSLRAVFGAKTLTDGSVLDRSKIVAFQFLLSKFEYDGNLNPAFTPGPFELNLKSIMAYKAGVAEKNAKIVLVSTAGASQGLRDISDVQRESARQPAEGTKVDRRMEWKFAGEDVVRASDVPYCILRLGPLKEGAAAGVKSLRLEQGDTTKDTISCEDIASLIVETFNTASMVCTTSEIAMSETAVRQPGGSISELASKLAKDDVSLRSYASFPFVPVK